MLNEFRVKEREALKFGLIQQVHHEQLVGGRQVGLLAGELLVEIADVFTMANAWLEWRLHLSIGDLLPVDSPKETVHSNVLFAFIAAAQTFGRIFGEKAFARIFCFFGHCLRIAYVVIGDRTEELLLVLTVKRRLSDQHLVEQNAERPPVHRLSVRLVCEDFGGLVFESG